MVDFFFFPFSILNISWHYLLACRVSAGLQKDLLLLVWAFHCVLLVSFPLMFYTLCFIIIIVFYTLCFIPCAFNLCVWYLLAWLVCVSTSFSWGLSCVRLCDSWTWQTISFPMLRKFSTIISSKVFSVSFFLCSSETPITQTLVSLILSYVSSHSFSFIFLFSSYFCHSVLYLTYLFLYLSYSTIGSF